MVVASVLQRRSHSRSTCHCCNACVTHAIWLELKPTLRGSPHSGATMGKKASAAAAMERPEKLARLAALRAEMPHMTASALSAVLQMVREGHITGDVVAGRRAVRQARDSAVSATTPYGKLHRPLRLGSLAEGGVEIEVAHPGAMLWHTAPSAPMQRLWRRALEHVARRNDPAVVLNVVLYADEVTPGNQLATRHARKVWAVYYTIHEFDALSLEDGTACCVGPPNWLAICALTRGCSCEATSLATVRDRRCAAVPRGILVQPSDDSRRLCC